MPKSAFPPESVVRAAQPPPGFLPSFTSMPFSGAPAKASCARKIRVAAAAAGKDFKAIRFEMDSLVIAPPKIFEHPILLRRRLSVPQMGYGIARGTGIALECCFAAMRPSCYAA